MFHFARFIVHQPTCESIWNTMSADQMIFNVVSADKVQYGSEYISHLLQSCDVVLYRFKRESRAMMIENGSPNLSGAHPTIPTLHQRSPLSESECVFSV